ncbi:FkbM family methyltransferase [Advenella mimigardefordensis]|uniref:N-terminal FkbM family methyltransferase domain-containing protein n=1 Tax=Advenella mimigardefordensis (strain DSM 17166 / LMG 22922 / DPN7) TaxID=1247726 RepID=W0PJU5_ADVMD|nr:FkbM family methyltransferase [Advenella mimigardefordensis]AHG65825.1 N-terminal FkbM family methyltransferase domain-containing protein [Advenella mimigardefordensis DPN7]
MNQHTNEPRFATVKADGVEYPIYLTSPNQDYIQKNLATTGIPYELPMLTDMKARLQPESTVLDIGANIGNHTFYLAQVLRCQVIAFEANDELAHAMDMTTSEAGLEERITVHAFALGDKPGFAAFEQAMPENLGGQALKKGTGRIKVRTLDSFGISAPISAIKIDVEGMELDVLKGGSKLIGAHLPMLYIEAQTKDSFLEISAYLREFGYVYRDTFNATPTHLFIHKTKLQDEGSIAKSSLSRVEYEYDLLTANKKIKKDLVDCQMKYRDISHLNSSLKLENERLQEQARLNAETPVSADDERLRIELDQAEKELADARLQIERLREDVFRERREKECQIQQFSQQNVADRLDAALQGKLTAEVERLTAENRSLSALLEGQQALKTALDESKKKCADMAFILENANAEVAQLQAERSKLLAKIKEIDEDRTQVLKLQEQIKQMQIKQQGLQAELTKQAEQLAVQEKKDNEQKLQLQSQAEQLTAMEKQAALVKELEVQIQQLSTETSRLQSENADLSTLLESSHVDSGKVEELELTLLDHKNRHSQAMEDNERLQSEIQQLNQALTAAENEVMGVRDLAQRQEDYKVKAEKSNEQLSRLTSELDSYRKEVERIPEMERINAALERQRDDYAEAIVSLKSQHQQYIEGMRLLHEQQQRDNEQQMQFLIQKKMESLAPLQANQEKLDKLIEYRNDIEKIYAERTPLLNNLQGTQGVEQIQDKKAALEDLNRQLAEFNNRSLS